MTHARGIECAFVWMTLASCALGGCYLTNERDRRTRPDEPAQEMRPPAAPPTAGTQAPVTPPRQPDPDPISPVSSDRLVSVAGEPGYLLLPHGRIVGDLDGDGFDDIVLFGMTLPEVDPASTPRSAAYVFYGRPEWPDVLEAASADAVLRGVGFAIPAVHVSQSVAGDLNGDRLADLVVGGLGAAYLVFGSADRLSGELAIEDAAVVWTFLEHPLPPAAHHVRAASAGDVNGDGLADFTLTLAIGRFDTEYESGTFSTPIDGTLLVAGQPGQWPSGTFEPEWAAAAFVAAEGQFGGCSSFGAADLNGDGFSDLLLQAEAMQRLVPGRLGTPKGTIVAARAGKPLELPATWVRPLPDIDGDGSQELAWTDDPAGERLHVSYGGSDLDPARLVEPEFTLAAEGMRLPVMDVADFDGDGAMELLVLGRGSGPRAPAFGLYVFATEELRGAGEFGLERGRLVLALEEGLGSPSPLSLGLGLDAGGDVNGDGIDDLLITTLALEPMSIGTSEIRLLASSPVR